MPRRPLSATHPGASSFNRFLRGPWAFSSALDFFCKINSATSNRDRPAISKKYRTRPPAVPVFPRHYSQPWAAINF